MTRMTAPCLWIGVLAIVFAICGCESKPPGVNNASPSAPAGAAKVDPVLLEREKLTPEDRAAVDAQEWCVVSSEERLGSMGPPIRLEIDGTPVYICCNGCKRKALSKPEQTLSKAKELQAKKKTQTKS